MIFRVGFITLVKREILRFLRVFNQTIIPPLFNAFLYLLIFGVFIGDRLGLIADIRYLSFLIPGIIIMDLINSAYNNSTATIFIAKWTKHIHEILVSPLTYIEITSAYIIGSVVRAFAIAIVTYFIAGLFNGFAIFNIWICFYFMFTISITFSAVGIIIALWSEDWEQLSILSNFFLTPLTFLGGVFYSLTMLPPLLKTITKLNPFFYIIDGFRYGMIGLSEGNLMISILISGFSTIIAMGTAIYLFKTGYKLRP